MTAPKRRGRRVWKMAKPVKAWVLVTERGRMVIGSVTMTENELNGAGFSSDRIARVLVREIVRRK